jgi:hypothetical protein
MLQDMKMLSPALFDLLSQQGQLEYIHMQETFSNAKLHAGRNRMTEMFGQILARVNSFVMKGDGNDIKRGLVCGIFWIHNQIAVNPLRFSTFISKSKSSINGGLHTLKYRTIQINCPDAFEFRNALQLSYATMRHWTVRIQNDVEVVGNCEIPEDSTESNVLIEQRVEDEDFGKFSSPDSFDFFSEFLDCG